MKNKKNYPLNGSPICPMDREICNSQDMDGYTECGSCQRYCNGVRKTGGMPGLELIYKSIKTLIGKW